MSLSGHVPWPVSVVEQPLRPLSVMGQQVLVGVLYRFQHPSIVLQLHLLGHLRRPRLVDREGKTAHATFDNIESRNVASATKDSSVSATNLDVNCHDYGTPWDRPKSVFCCSLPLK